MLNLTPALRRLPRSGPPKIGIAIAGGGPIGGIYELGALRALDDAIDGLDLNRLDCYVGVSSGAFLASALVNKIDTEEMCRILVTGKDVEHPFEPEIFLKPAFGELLRRLALLPELTGKAFLDLFRHPMDQRVTAAIGRFGAALPTGLFDNEGIEQFLRRLFTTHGRTNDFRDLDRPLRVIAVDLDTSERVCFGAPGQDKVPISRAVQASSALPGLYPPVKIHGHYYVDGALKRTLHGSIALDEGAELLIGLNPLVPFDANRARENGVESPRSLVSGGLPVVLSQTIRALLHSRMQVGLSKYDQRYENADVVLFEPDPDDSTMFFTNVFSFASRARLCAHAYHRTLRDLRARADALAPVLARHGLSLNLKVLAEQRRTLWSSLRTHLPRRTSATARLRRVLDDLNHEVQRLGDTGTPPGDRS
ncbi:MAG: patatin-like phospholipase family protein [Xanthomonadales bacterium]|jgi:predicted acylesterase/phospholipase RssA|nr:patatin-like phospholipase family protein [Xanthomonadales bacterium]